MKNKLSEWEWWKDGGHEAGNEDCPLCTYTERCKCGGLIHHENSYDDVNEDVIPEACCDSCDFGY